MKRKISQSVAACALFGAVVAAGQGVANAALLSVDVDDRTATDGSTTNSGTQPGFGSYMLGATGGTSGVTSSDGVTQTVDGYSINLAPVIVYPNGGGSGTLDDRDRNFSLPPGATTTIVQVYDDFVFQNSATGGIRLTIGGGELQPNTQYALSIYSYDHASSGTRTADYVDKNNNDAYVLTTRFTGGQVPPSDDANKYTGLAVTDANGFLRLNGINTTAISSTTGLPTTFGLFINGIEVSAVPEPTAAMGLLGFAGLAAARRRSR